MSVFPIIDFKGLSAGAIAIAYQDKPAPLVFVSAQFNNGLHPVLLSAAVGVVRSNSDILDPFYVTGVPLLNVTGHTRVMLHADDLLQGCRLASMDPAGWPGHLVIGQGMKLFAFKMPAGHGFEVYFLDLDTGNVIGQRHFNTASALAFRQWSLEVAVADSPSGPVYEPLVTYPAV